MHSAAGTPSPLIRFNKPYGVLSQFTAEGRWQGLAGLIDLPGYYVAGRLDADSEGLLLLTSDGKLQARIADPRFKMEKTYWVQVDGEPDAAALDALRRGVKLNDGMTLPARVAQIAEPPGLWARVPPIRVRTLRGCDVNSGTVGAAVYQFTSAAARASSPVPSRAGWVLRSEPMRSSSAASACSCSVA